MTYEQKFDAASKKFIVYCKGLITENFDQMFDMWLQMEADMEFGHGYEKIFKEQFGNYITEDVKKQLWFDGKNIIYAINAFIKIKKFKYKLKDLLDFVEGFVTEQLGDFDNNYDVSGWYNTEESTHTDDNPTNDNPV